MTCYRDHYDLRGATKETLVVDFADSYAGGDSIMPNAPGVSGRLQALSAEYAACLGLGRYEPGDDQAFTFRGVTVDLSMTRAGVMWKCLSGPTNIITVDVPKMPWGSSYNKKHSHSLLTLAKKTLLVFQVARALELKSVYSGLLGAGPRCGSRPLAMLLHMLLMPDGVELKLHYPILWTRSTYTLRRMEDRLANIVENMLESLREKKVSTMGEALRVILTWELATSHGEFDILGEGRFDGN